MMAKKIYFVLVVSAFLSVYYCLPKSTANPGHKPDGGDRIKSDDLSDKEHFNDEEEHNEDYDHEAFLGKETAEEFDNLTPEESQRRLAIIYDKIDHDNDKFVTEEELRDWIKFVQKRYILEDVDRQWPTHDENDDGAIEWSEYKRTTYGYEKDDEGENDENEQDGFSYREMLQRDKRRWEVADQDNDGKLSKDEFTAFLHPEDYDHMKDIVVKETLEDIDKNNDGFVSVDEYIGDMYHANEDEPEPDWVQTEREQFNSHRDKDGDGKMSLAEVKEWILPSEYDHSLAEARHLFHESDSDGDKKLSKEEVLAKKDLFVGSQATDFGEALARHDEF